MWILPSFGRAQRCQETLDSIIGVGSTTSGIVVVDGSTDAGYRNLCLPPKWEIAFGAEHIGFCARLNKAFARFPEQPWYGFLADDFIVCTPEWDRRLIDAAANRNFASPNDGWMRERFHLSGAVVFGGDLLRAFGWWVPPGLWHMYADNAWQDIARALKNFIHLPDVLVEHRHHLNGLAPKDRTYEIAAANFAEDHCAYQKFCERELPAAIARARELW